MADRKIPDPITNPETEAFWSAAKEGRFLVRKCKSCGEAHWYPRAVCPFCASTDTEWVPGSGRGTIYSYCVMRRAAEPFVMAYVTLAEGPSMMTNIVDCDFDAIAIGQPVELVFKPSVGGYAIPMFRPAAQK